LIFGKKLLIYRGLAGKEAKPHLLQCEDSH
jgi:hypothetical protein